MSNEPHKQALVTSTRSKTDMRRLDISLTDAGVVFIEEAVVTAREITRATLQNLTPRERDRLLVLLDKL